MQKQFLIQETMELKTPAPGMGSFVFESLMTVEIFFAILISFHLILIIMQKCFVKKNGYPAIAAAILQGQRNTVFQ